MAEKHVIRGVLAGIAGGLVAAWAMNQWSAGPGAAMKNRLESQEDQEREKAAQGDAGDATMQAADGLATPARGGVHLTSEGKAKGGPIVHYTYGALVGGLYGGLAEYSKLVRSGFGTTYASALFVGGDLIAVPAFGLAKPLDAYPLASYAGPFTSHLVYGATTELVRRIVRSIL